MAIAISQLAHVDLKHLQATAHKQSSAAESGQSCGVILTLDAE